MLAIAGRDERNSVLSETLEAAVVQAPIRGDVPTLHLGDQTRLNGADVLLQLQLCLGGGNSSRRRNGTLGTSYAYVTP